MTFQHPFTLPGVSETLPPGRYVVETDEELLEVRNFGETTLKEVKLKLQERNLQLGMKLPASLRR